MRGISNHLLLRALFKNRNLPMKDRDGPLSCLFSYYFDLKKGVIVVVSPWRMDQGEAVAGLFINSKLLQSI